MNGSSLDLLRKYVKRVSEAVKINAVVLFGSRARGDHGPWSDYDLFIMGEFHEKYLDRLKTLIDLSSGFKLSIEPHPYTFEEAVEMLEKGHPTVVDAIEEGIVITADEKYDRLLEKYREMKKAGKLKRTKTSITF